MVSGGWDGSEKVFPHSSAKYMNFLLKEMSVQAEDAEGVVREVIGGLAFSVTKGLTS